MCDWVIVGFIHIDVVCYYFVRSSSGEYVANVLELWRVGKMKFMMLNVFVERKYLSFRGWVVGIEELEVEVMLIDWYVEDKANSAHSNY